MKWYKLVFKQEQPLHIGSLTWGVLSETNIFIPGWTMWGALTKAYNITQKQNLNENQHLFEKITCFYPSFDEKGINILLPDYKNGVFHLGKLSEYDFGLSFVNTFVSTAIDPVSRKATDESLHEMDYILPKGKKESSYKEKQLFWVGLVRVEGSVKEGFFKRDMSFMVGGETKYGYGLMKLTEIIDATDDDFNLWNLNEDANFKIKQNNPIRNFLELTEETKSKIEKGEITLLGEFNFRETPPKLQDAKFFITIGSKVKDISEKFTLLKGKFVKIL